MGDRYNLYESLKLDSAASTEELHANLSSQLTEMQKSGIAEYSGEYQETLTAFQILGDEGRRREHDALLADENATITIATLRELASRPTSAAPASTFSPAPNQAAQQQNAQPETNANSGAQNEAPQFSFQQQSQQSQAQPQQGQPQWPNPAQTGPMTVTTTVTTDVPPLPEDASLQDAWKRLPRFPKITAGLLAGASVLGYILAAAAIILGINNLNSALEAQERDSSLASIGDDIRDIYVGLINVSSGAAFFALGIVIAVISMFWLNKVLLGRNIRAPYFLVATTGPLGVGLVAMCYFIQDVFITIFAGLSGLTLIAVTVLVLLKDMRAWFRGQKLVRTTQSAPGQGYAPQHPQSQNIQGYQFGQNNPPNNTQN